MQRKLIVVSMDALVYEDLAYLSQKPSFGWLMEKGAMVRRVRSIYPTLTYPCHATMATGCLPKKHGVVNNTHFAPGVVDSPWLWFHEVYRVRDIFDACKEKGLSTASIGWPSTGNHPNIDYLVGEIACTSAKTEEEFYRDYTLTGTPRALWGAVCAPNVHYRTYFRSPAAFNAAVCRDIIRLYAPDLVMLHVGEPDHSRHGHGVFSRKLEPALDMCEWVLTQLLQAIRDSGAEDAYNLVITADHGQLDTTRTVCPNVLLAQNGFLDVDQGGKVTNWRAWSHSVGMCATVYVKDPADEPAVYALLKAHLGQGYSRIYTQEEAAKEGFAGDFAFVLETDGQTAFKDTFTGEYMIELGTVMGSHGFHPDKGPRPTLIGVGPVFRTGVVLETADLVDGAPTWAAILGTDLPDADGKILDALLK